jgi:hypothetical protein
MVLLSAEAEGLPPPPHLPPPQTPGSEVDSGLSTNTNPVNKCHTFLHSSTYSPQTQRSEVGSGLSTITNPVNNFILFFSYPLIVSLNFLTFPNASSL